MELPGAKIKMNKLRDWTEVGTQVICTVVVHNPVCGKFHLGFFYSGWEGGWLLRL